jgi:hypothetical protein
MRYETSDLLATTNCSWVALGSASSFFTSFSLAQTTSSLKITMSPSLYPAFNSDNSDYVVNAGADSSVTVSVDATTNIQVSVDGKPFASRKFDVKLPKITEGQSFKILVPYRRAGVACGETKVDNIRRIPSDFPTWTTKRRGTPQSEFYLFAPTLRVDFGDLRHYDISSDSNGVPIWWYRGAAIPVPSSCSALWRRGMASHLLD